MILAAGLGQRMRPLTDHTPKPMLPVADKPLILYHIERLRTLGVKELVINIAHLGHKIRQYLGDGSQLGVSIYYSEEAEPLETAGAIHQALNQLGAEPFLLINGDVWSDYSLLPLRNEQLPVDVLGQLLLVPNPEYREAGDFSLRDGVVCQREANEAGYTFSGISLMRPQLIADYPHCRSRFALREVFDWAIAQGRLRGEVYSGRWWDVGTPERLAALDAQLRTAQQKPV